MTYRDIAIGDVHGCIDELNELLCLVSYKPGRDRLVFVGDLVDRGPDSLAVLRRVRELTSAGTSATDASCVMGNHDEWYVRCAKHEARKRATGKKNPLQQNKKKFALYQQMSDEDIAWLSALPYLHRIDFKTVVVHAGFRPGIPVEQQDEDDMLRMRYLKSDKLTTPVVEAYWTEVWTGPEDVVYGHSPSKTDAVLTAKPTWVGHDPETDRHARGYVRCWGIDTGCCFGNKLTAWVREPGGSVELVSVRARAQYADWHKSLRDS